MSGTENPHGNIENGSNQMDLFLHPNAPEGVNLPPPGQTSKELYALLDSDKVDFRAKGFIVRMRYPVTATRIDAKFNQARDAHIKDLTDEGKKKAYRNVIGLTGAYNYIRGMDVIKADGTIDREVAPKMMLSPSAALQLLEVADIREEDRVLDMFCGTGYATFALGTANPQRLDAVDNYTVPRYKLPETMQRAQQMIYRDVPEGLKPTVTMPKFIDEDCTSLSRFDSAGAKEKGFAEHYDKVFLHPPYGRESTRMMPSISEGDAFILWINSLRSVREANNGNATVFSIVPEEWKGAVQNILKGDPVESAIRTMYNQLRELKYYQFEENVPKLSEPVHLDKAEGWNPDELRQIFGNSSATLLEETGMFGLHLHKITLP